MLHEPTIKHISSLGDSDLLEYVLTGERMYEKDAVAFAQQELDCRNLTAEQLEVLRPPIIAKLAQHDATASHDMPGSKRPDAILCQRCGYEAPTKYMIYHQNIGAIHIRFYRTYKGSFCKNCNHKIFWKATLICLFAGWWGLISFFANIDFLVGNAFTYMRALLMPPVPHGATQPQVDDLAMAHIAPHVYAISEKLTAGMDAFDISRELAPQARVTPGQMLCFIQTMIVNQTETTNPKTYGFPVIASNTHISHG